MISVGVVSYMCCYGIIVIEVSTVCYVRVVCAHDVDILQCAIESVEEPLMRHWSLIPDD